MKICKNETVLQQDIIPNNFHSILGMGDALGLGFDTAYAAKKSQEPGEQAPLQRSDMRFKSHFF